jgi:uncharacterized membrane protein YhiD involved in acid resistance
MPDILTLQANSAHPTLITAFYTVMVSFLLSVLVAMTYEKTFRGLSYSRSFVQALVLAAIVAATVMQAIGDSLATGLGMMGALAIIRFRTGLKDPRDIIFMFASLASGISCGVGAYHVAVVGTSGFSVAAFILYLSPFGQTSAFDGMLRFNMENDAKDKGLLVDILKENCQKFALITLRDAAQGKRMDYAYHIKMKRGRDKGELVNALNTITHIRGVSLLLQETSVEL